MIYYGCNNNCENGKMNKENDDEEEEEEKKFIKNEWKEGHNKHKKLT